MSADPGPSEVSGHTPLASSGQPARGPEADRGARRRQCDRTGRTRGRQGAARPWLLAAAFTDTVDAVATLAARRALPSPGAPGTVALAATSAAVGLWTARRLA